MERFLGRYTKATHQEGKVRNQSVESRCSCTMIPGNISDAFLKEKATAFFRGR